MTGTITSYDDNPVENARIWSPRVDPQEPSPYIRTNQDGEFTATVPKGKSYSLRFYKSDEDNFHAPRLDGVPHIYNIGRLSGSDEDIDLGTIRLPEAHVLDIRAVFAEQQGVEDAGIGFASLDDNGWFGSAPSSLTTTSDGFLKITAADFTGVEMAENVRVVVKPPDHPKYVDEDVERIIEVMKDTLLEVDLSKRRSRN